MAELRDGGSNPEAGLPDGACSRAELVRRLAEAREVAAACAEKSLQAWDQDAKYRHEALLLAKFNFCAGAPPAPHWLKLRTYLQNLRDSGGAMLPEPRTIAAACADALAYMDRLERPARPVPAAPLPGAAAPPLVFDWERGAPAPENKEIDV